MAISEVDRLRLKVMLKLQAEGSAASETEDAFLELLKHKDQLTEEEWNGVARYVEAGRAMGEARIAMSAVIKRTDIESRLDS